MKEYIQFVPNFPLMTPSRHSTRAKWGISLITTPIAILKRKSFFVILSVVSHFMSAVLVLSHQQLNQVI